MTSIITVPHKRKAQGKTNYRKRLNILQGGKKRLVVRKFIRNMLAQIVEYDSKGDKIIASAHSRELKKLGFKIHTGSIMAAYLVGLLVGNKAKKAGVKEAVLDCGIYTTSKGSRLYAVMKGVIDAGIAVPHSKEILPTEDRLLGKHVENYANSLKGKDQYKKQFSDYIKNGIAPENVSKHVEEIKNKILKGG